MCQWYLREKTNVVSKRAYLWCFGDFGWFWASGGTYFRIYLSVEREMCPMQDMRLRHAHISKSHMKVVSKRAYLGCFGWPGLQVAHVSQYTYRTDGKRGPCTTYSHIKLIEWHLRRWFRWCVNDTSVKKLMWFPKERIWDVLVIWWFKVILGDFEHHVSHVCEYTYRAGHKRESCNTCSHIKS